MRVIVSKTPEFPFVSAMTMAAHVYDNRHVPRMRDVAIALLYHPAPSVRSAMASFAWDRTMLDQPRMGGTLPPLVAETLTFVRDAATARCAQLDNLCVGTLPAESYLGIEARGALTRARIDHCGYVMRAEAYDPLQPSMCHFPGNPHVKCLLASGHMGKCEFPVASEPGAPVELVWVDRETLGEVNAAATVCHACGGKHRDGAKFTGAASEFVHYRGCPIRPVTHREVMVAYETSNEVTGPGPRIPVSKIRTLGEAAELRIAALPSRCKPEIVIHADLDLED